ncbi:Acetyltransferase (GNAT) family protein [Vibrio thalassae]|uniref:Acetyltransferase (GNAT) family protein n=1 Tax=Vibrio thalassae TaxID=1243014 RepID=A0A240EHZ2_9VIBR|nr:GNAT family N-acetyltransferase [Vibrio thalassae]SNX48121.1 Acetyltransferase (GNAT) family protein [Vibrio thalassae]
MKVEIVSAIPAYDAALCAVIQSVGAEFGAIGEGFGPSDPEVLAMSENYSESNRSVYLVALVNGKVVGGCGLAPFGLYDGVCELKKLFLLPETRGLGLGKKLVQQCLSFAREQGYTSCYLDTLASMSAAIRLYEKFGFTHLNSPYEGTLHNGCDVWMLKTLP